MHKVHPKRDDARLGGEVTVSYAGRSATEAAPRFDVPAQGMAAGDAYRLIRDELELEGSARLNLATFVTTWMEPEAERLLAVTANKNLIDRDEYPIVAAMEQRCVNMIARLFHAPGEQTDGGAGVGVGVSTIGSSEAAMLAGMAMKWKWRTRRKPEGREAPNLVMSAGVQVVWEKFCRYWDVQPRYVPVAEGRYTLDPAQAAAKVDENTIGVLAILGTTYTGEYEPIEAIDVAVGAVNKKNGWEVPIHVDAASGGFVAPFVDEEFVWDFRLPWVRSINASGHKYGLVYPGVGWVLWREQADLPRELVFDVDYLGGNMPTFTLNFSRPASQVVGQYYNFLRLGRTGFQRVMQTLRTIGAYLSEQIDQLGPFQVVTRADTALPVLTFRLKKTDQYSAYDVSHQLRAFGWQLPAYAMAPDMEKLVLLRVVLRDGFTRDMAEMLVHDLKAVTETLSANPPAHPRGPVTQFHH